MLFTFYLHFQHPLYWDLNDSSGQNENKQSDVPVLYGKDLDVRTTAQQIELNRRGS